MLKTQIFVTRPQCVKIQVHVETVYVAEELVATYQTIQLHDVEGHNKVLIHQGKFYFS